MDKDRALQIRQQIIEDLSAMCDERGLSLSVKGAAKYGDTYVILNLQLAEVGADGVAKSVEAENFAMFATLDDVPKSALGRTFVINGAEFRLMGYNHRATKSPYLATRLSDGARFKFTPAAIRREFGVVRR